MAASKKNKAKKKVKPKYDTEKYKKKVRDELNKAEEKITEHYKALVAASGKNWGKESKKYKTQIKKQLKNAEKKINANIKKNPAQAAVVASAIGIGIGAVAMSLLKRRK